MSKKHRRKVFRQKQGQQLEKDKAGAFEFVQKINFILSKVRESDVGMMETTPSDDPDKQTISRVSFPPEGGIFTHFDNFDHPAKGFCYGETVETVDEVKKTMMAFLSGFFESISKSKLRTLLFALIFRKQFMAIVRRLVVQLDYRMRRVRQKPERYCISGREFYRVFRLMAVWHPKYEKEINSFRNIWCMGWEYDDAYRYTGQDVLPELNKEAIKKDIVKEIKRILDLTLERDNRGLFIKFSQMRKLLFLLKFSKSIRTIVERFLLELDLDKMKMDEDDKFHACFKENYNWDHIPNYKDEQEKKDREKKEDKKEV